MRAPSLFTWYQLNDCQVGQPKMSKQTYKTHTLSRAKPQSLLEWCGDAMRQPLLKMEKMLFW